MQHATLADARYELCCELSSGNGPFRTAKMVITCYQIMSEILWMYILFYGCDSEWTLGNMETGSC